MYPYPKSYSPLLTLSDHTPLVYNTHQIAGNIFTWNILVQGRFNQRNQYFNNGFGIIESSDEYHIRLKYVAKEIADFAEQHNIGILTLQEMPKSSEDIYYFMDLLEENLNATKHQYRIHKDFLNLPQGNFLVFDKERFSAQNITSDFQDNIELIEQNNNYQYFEIQNLEKQTKFALINAHFYWHEPMSREFFNSVTDIRSIIESAENYSDISSVIMCGDFNLDLDSTDLSRDYAVYTVRDTTLAHKYDRNIQVLETVDGFVAYTIPK
ncbi:MAG: hypothetical protein J0G32_00250 [Alphaproteobacteria bacterium]|nr:hypothetical protein [Alphaproteobacteria bacterium]OJV13589.1 MAG: hypothetical protein BGO27_03125 [Alphaproteobacteria bacterium 33-17]